jgi:uncharacterized membrane protein YqjE
LRTVAALASTRIDLAKAEVGECVNEIASVVVTGLVAAILAILAVEFAVVAALIALPAPWRTPASAGLALVLAVVAIGCGLRARHRVRSLPSLKWVTVLGFLLGQAKSGILDLSRRHGGNYG